MHGSAWLLRRSLPLDFLFLQQRHISSEEHDHAQLALKLNADSNLWTGR